MAAVVGAGNEAIEWPANRWFHGGSDGGHKELVNKSLRWLWRLGFGAGCWRGTGMDWINLYGGGHVEMGRSNGGTNS